jgi:flagellar biosynthesis/type III secretory pathway M-ring protein FliF/YscJ
MNWKNKQKILISLMLVYLVIVLLGLVIWKNSTGSTIYKEQNTDQRMRVFRALKSESLRRLQLINDQSR